MDGHRYINTEEDGWVDMRHFFAAADLSEDWGSEIAEALGFGVELQQDFHDDPSAWSSEDLPSNKAGAKFGANYRGECCSNFKKDLKKFLKGRKIRDPRGSNTGFDKLPRGDEPGAGGSISGNQSDTDSTSENTGNGNTNSSGETGNTNSSGRKK